MSPLTIGHADVEPHDILALKISHAVLRIKATCTCSTLMTASLRITDCERCLGAQSVTVYNGDLRKSYLPTPWTIRNRQSLIPRFEV